MQCVLHGTIPARLSQQARQRRLRQDGLDSCLSRDSPDLLIVSTNWPEFLALANQRPVVCRSLPSERSRQRHIGATAWKVEAVLRTEAFLPNGRALPSGLI